MTNQLEVHLDNFKYNYNEIKKLIKPTTEIMPILKDNAYMTYINTQIDLLNELNINIIGLANALEGENMRRLGFDKEIFILNQPLNEDIERIAKSNLTIGCCSSDFIEKLGNYPANFNIHIEIGTGMGRTGINPYKIPEFIDLVKKYSNITVTGIYTHFSCSDSDEEYTQKQISIFNEAVSLIKENISTIKYVHACNSAGIINYPEAHFNLVRPGIILYGYYPSPELKEKLNLKPVVKLKSKISFLKEVPSGVSISYGATFTTSRPSIIATIPIGYSHGICRVLSNKGSVVINKKIAPIVGTICMDSLMVDVTDIPANLNDDVYIFDNENITLDEIASLCNTINYEFLVGISNKIERVFI